MEPITLVLAKDLVTEKLREAIYTSVLKPGEELILQKISEQLGVSRMPVREALAILESAGIVEMLPNKHVIVKKVTPEMIDEDLELRSILECNAAEKACRRAANFDGLETINRKTEQCAAKGDIAPFRDLNAQFHHTIWSLARSPRLERMLKQLWFAMPSYYPVNTLENLNRNVREHSLILEALQARDISQVLKAMAAHIHHTQEMIVRRMQE